MPVHSHVLPLSPALASLALPLLALWTSQVAAETAQVEQGEEIAEQICTTCHRVPDEDGAPVGPAFSTLAERGDWTAEQLQQVMNAEEHEEAVPASKLQLEAVASYLNQLED